MIVAISRIYRFMRILSLDVALGSVVLSNSVAYAFRIELPASISVALFIAVWLIYTFDHLMDAGRLPERASMPRHQFHQNYRKIIIVMMLVTFGIGAFNLLFVPMITLIFGFLVLLIVLIYFVLSWKMKIFMIKELFIASVYTSGVFLGPASLGITNLTVLLHLVFQVFVLALLNLLVFSYYEMSKDKQDGQYSWAIRFGQQATRVHMNIVFVILALLQIISLIFLSAHFARFQSLFLVMSAVLFLIFRREIFFSKHERYRSLGDLIFFLPGLIFWF